MQGIGELIDLNSLIGKTLYAAKPVKLYRFTADYYDGKPAIFTVQAGQAIGVVDTWIQKGPDYWFLYYDSNKRLYVSRHVKGDYSLKQLQNQGVKTEEQKLKEAEQASKTWFEKIFSTKNLLIVAGVYLAGQAIKFRKQ